MALRFIGKDPPSKNGDSPSVWLDDRDGSLVFQMWRVEDPAVVAELLETSGRDPVPAHEALGRVPATLIPLILEAINESRRSERPDSG